MRSPEILSISFACNHVRQEVTIGFVIIGLNVCQEELYKQAHAGANVLHAHSEDAVCVLRMYGLHSTVCRCNLGEGSSSPHMDNCYSVLLLNIDYDQY